jgi:hypothetical protein
MFNPYKDSDIKSLNNKVENIHRFALLEREKERKKCWGNYGILLEIRHQSHLRFLTRGRISIF